MNPTPVIVPFVDLSWQNQSLEAEINSAIHEVIHRGDFVLGQALRDFETMFAQACGVEYGVGVASGTDAIALGLQACNISIGDEVIVPANTFIASILGIIQAGAKPILADCDPETALIDLENAAKLVTKRTKAILPVHLYGQMVSPSALLDFADAHNLMIFEDSAQAHLAAREGYRAGTIGIGAGFSFYPSKNLGAFGDSGIFITSNSEIAQRVRSLRNYGAPSKYLHTEVGKNSRLDTIQAAILKTKLPYLEQWNQQRHQAAIYYDQLLKPLATQGITPLVNYSSSGHVYHLYVIKIAPSYPLKREQIQEKLQQKGIQTGIHYPIPCHLQPGYNFLGYQSGDFPHVEALCEQILSLPIYPGITPEQIEFVVDNLTQLNQ